MDVDTVVLMLLQRSGHVCISAVRLRHLLRVGWKLSKQSCDILFLRASTFNEKNAKENPCLLSLADSLLYLVYPVKCMEEEGICERARRERERDDSNLERSLPLRRDKHVGLPVVGRERRSLNVSLGWSTVDEYV